MRVQELLGVDLPIIQAPMAGVQNSELALAVSSVGGLGSIPCAMLSHDALRAELSRIQSHTQAPINVNFFSHHQPEFNAERDVIWRRTLAPYFSEYAIDSSIDSNALPKGPSRQPFSDVVADILEEFRPQVVSFHFGLPEKALLARVKAWGATVLSTATTLEEALWLEANGADAIIAQGIEAGGHRGMFLSAELGLQVSTYSLLQQILARVSLPVIATGGISDAKGVSAALSLGAAAVQVGTAYLLCDETNTSVLHRQAIKSNRSHKTVITNLFSGKPARGIVNRVIQELGPISELAPEFPHAATAITAIRQAAEAQGSSDFSPLWCGQNTSGCKEISAVELTLELARGLGTR
ncbi:2-nitropropane dioxygenase-like enzyme [Shewanella psychrophila]|uniref:Nitronate monooxygenase n=2 Tax=Shewanella psychrophila TaxID=225848 RepID=A0A1S6HS61_9GAMM|nr:2-nitropropane dioxygenase-like enzyme [Shewanella psychrophila]